MQQTDRRDMGTRPKLMQLKNVIEYILSILSYFFFSMNLPSPTSVCWVSFFQFCWFNSSQFSGVLLIPNKTKEQLTCSCAAFWICTNEKDFFFLN